MSPLGCETGGERRDTSCTALDLSLDSVLLVLSILPGMRALTPTVLEKKFDTHLRVSIFCCRIHLSPGSVWSIIIQKRVVETDHQPSNLMITIFTTRSNNIFPSMLFYFIPNHSAALIVKINEISDDWLLTMHTFCYFFIWPFDNTDLFFALYSVMNRGTKVKTVRIKYGFIETIHKSIFFRSTSVHSSCGSRTVMLSYIAKGWWTVKSQVH
jgi:hypothetical protein